MELTFHGHNLFRELKLFFLLAIKKPAFAKMRAFLLQISA